MTVRPIREDDLNGFYTMLCKLDSETQFMLYEPGERQATTPDCNRLRHVIASAVSGDDLLLVAENVMGEIVGFLSAERGSLHRIRHSAYIVTGIRKAYRRQGIGTEFFRRLDEWAKENGIVRLELTVECTNVAGVALYEKNGFSPEGVRSKSMKIDGVYVDEYYMGKIMK